MARTLGLADEHVRLRAIRAHFLYPIRIHWVHWVQVWDRMVFPQGQHLNSISYQDPVVNDALQKFGGPPRLRSGLGRIKSPMPSLDRPATHTIGAS